MNQKQWWHNIGSGIIPREDDDMEDHTKRVSEAAWNAATAAGIGIDLAKPGSERCVKISIDDDGNIKLEEIPISRIMKDVE